MSAKNQLLQADLEECHYQHDRTLFSNRNTSHLLGCHDLITAPDLPLNMRGSRRTPSAEAVLYVGYLTFILRVDPSIQRKIKELCNGRELRNRPIIYYFGPTDVLRHRDVTLDRIG